jgi:hypothetical protein
MSIDGRLHVPGEVRIGHRPVAQVLLVCPNQRDAFADPRSWTSRRADHRDWSVIPLHDHFDAGLDYGQRA